MNLEDLINKAGHLRDESTGKFGSMSSDQLNWKPNSEEWSVGQVFDHLITSNELYLGNLGKVVDGTHTDNAWSKIPFLTRLMGSQLIKAVSPESTRKIKTFRVFQPTSSDVPETVIGHFNEVQEKLISMMGVLNAKDLKKRIVTPLGSILNIAVGDALQMLLLHEARHFGQADRVVGSDGFPA